MLETFKALHKRGTTTLRIAGMSLLFPRCFFLLLSERKEVEHMNQSGSSVPLPCSRRREALACSKSRERRDL